MASGVGNYLMKSLPSATRVEGASSSVQLYRTITKELPRVLILYDIDMSFQEARSALAASFRRNGHLKDPRVIDTLVMKGYMELEETTMQYKQKTHLLKILEPMKQNPARSVRDDFMDKFMAGTD
ncbi:unnamed protein product [Choristocarpus tenellus]